MIFGKFVIPIDLIYNIIKSKSRKKLSPDMLMKIIIVNLCLYLIVHWLNKSKIGHGINKINGPNIALEENSNLRLTFFIKKLIKDQNKELCSII